MFYPEIAYLWPALSKKIIQNVNLGVGCCCFCDFEWVIILKCYVCLRREKHDPWE